MHDIDRTQPELDPEQFEPEGEAFQDEGSADEAEALGDEELGEDAGREGEAEGPFSDGEELELAQELLGISDEAELDQFLGGVLKRAWKQVKRYVPAAIPIPGQLRGILQGVAKQVVPTLAGAAGTFLGGPAGGAIAAKLGSLASQALQSELEGLGPDDRDLEAARRLVRVAGTAAAQAATARPGGNPLAVAQDAVTAAVRQHMPGDGGYRRRRRRGRSGRWVRKGDRIIIYL